MIRAHSIPFIRPIELGWRDRSISQITSDAMCGAKHTEAGIAPADCVRACVQKGAKYALVVGDKVYTLSTSDQASLRRTEQAGLGASQSYGHRQRRYHFSEVGRCRQVRSRGMVAPSLGAKCS